MNKFKQFFHQDRYGWVLMLGVYTAICCMAGGLAHIPERNRFNWHTNLTEWNTKQQTEISDNKSKIKNNATIIKLIGYYLLDAHKNDMTEKEYKAFRHYFRSE